MNISVPPKLQSMVASLVEEGRFSSASEVFREGLRLLEREEQRRLLNKWLIEGLTVDEEAQLPAELLGRARSHFNGLIEEGLHDLREGRLVDGETVMRELRERIERRRAPEAND